MEASPVYDTAPRPEDEIRFCLIDARKAAESPARDALISSLLARAMIEARGEDCATEAVLADRFGFTADELARHGRAARDKATIQWLRRWPVAQVAA